MKQESDYTVFISGAPKGIGRAIAMHLARPNTMLLLGWCKSELEINSLAQLAEKQGAKTKLFQANLSDYEQRENMLNAILKETHKIDVIINNVAQFNNTYLTDIKPHDWQNTISSNLVAVAHIMTKLLPRIRQSTRGRIINLGDSLSDRITAHLHGTHYHIAKLGVHALTRSYASALIAEGITVNMLSPGFFENSVGKTPHIPAQRTGKYSDLLHALDSILAADAEYITGNNILISGGWNL